MDFYWQRPGDLDLPGEHPMLRREHQSHAQPLQPLRPWFLKRLLKASEREIYRE